MLLEHAGQKYVKVRGSAESDENGTIGPGELGTFGTKSSDGPEKNRLRVNRPIGEQRAQLNLGHAGQNREVRGSAESTKMEQFGP
ncbi:hypothetical protein KI387_006389, partial [Taxus chinensis]